MRQTVSITYDKTEVSRVPWAGSPVFPMYPFQTHTFFYTCFKKGCEAPKVRAAMADFGEVLFT